MAYTFKVKNSLSLPVNVNKPKRQSSIPPGNPYSLYGTGDYCIRAEIDVFYKEEPNKKYLNIRGYDSSMEIIQTVENACTRNVKDKPLICGKVGVTILKNYAKTENMECEGLFFELTDKNNKIV